MGYKAQLSALWIFSCTKQRCSVHPASSTLQSSLGGIMGWIASSYSSLGSCQLSQTSNVSVSRSRQPLVHPPFGGLTVQVHLQLWLFSLQSFVFPSARQSTSHAGSPHMPAIHSPPSTFQKPWSTTRANYDRELGIKLLMVETNEDVAPEKCGNLCVCVCDGSATNPPVIICYLNPSTGKIHLSFSGSREGKGRISEGLLAVAWKQGPVLRSSNASAVSLWYQSFPKSACQIFGAALPRLRQLRKALPEKHRRVGVPAHLQSDISDTACLHLPREVSFCIALWTRQTSPI